jgi:hypothetical protein
VEKGSYRDADLDERIAWLRSWQDLEVKSSLTVCTVLGAF